MKRMTVATVNAVSDAARKRNRNQRHDGAHTMKLVIDDSIEQARTTLVWIKQHGDSKPCLELSFESGILKLIHAPILHLFVITHESVRFEVSGALDPSNLRAGLVPGADLRRSIDEVRCAALIDRAVLTACRNFTATLDTMYSRSSLSLSGPALTPYDFWTYGIEPDGTGEFSGRLLAFPTDAHVQAAKKQNRSLVEYRLEDLLRVGRTPLTAQICAAEDDQGYQFMREKWISTAITSLVEKVDQSIRTSIQRNTFPDESFQSCIFLADRLYVIKLDMVHGVSVDATTAGMEELNQVRREVSERGGAQIKYALNRLRARV